MSEAESPHFLEPEHDVTIEDVRAITGASTPHFALQMRERVRRLIAPLPEGHPARLEGERKIAELERLAWSTGEPRDSEPTEALGRGRDVEGGARYEAGTTSGERA